MHDAASIKPRAQQGSPRRHETDWFFLRPHQHAVATVETLQYLRCRTYQFAMKSIFPLCLALLAGNVASAQVFRPQTMNGAVLERRAQHQSRDGARHDRHDGRSGHGHFEQRRGYHDFHHGHAPYREHYPYAYFPRYSYVPSYGYY